MKNDHDDDQNDPFMMLIKILCSYGFSPINILQLTTSLYCHIAG